MNLYLNGSKIIASDTRKRKNWIGPFNAVAEVQGWLRANGYKHEADGGSRHDVNEVLKWAGIRATLIRDPHGYHYFIGDDIPSGVSSGIYVYRTSDLTIQQWLNDARALRTAHDAQLAKSSEQPHVDLGLEAGTLVDVKAHTSAKGNGLTYPAIRGARLAEYCNGEGWDVVDLEGGTSVYSFDVTRAKL